MADVDQSFLEDQNGQYPLPPMDTFNLILDGKQSSANGGTNTTLNGMPCASITLQLIIL